MNKTYTLQDGGTITATCAIEFVTKLRQSSRFDSECTDQEYMYHLPIDTMTSLGTPYVLILPSTFYPICFRLDLFQK